MSINGISGASPLVALQGPSASQRPEPVSSTDRAQAPAFSERLGSALEGLAKSQTEAAEKASAFERGEGGNLAEVMVSQQVSSLGFQLALNVRNKALGAYRDIMNMPV
ncbi:flagellar hook-basal body complex protein FliE [Cereibacter azotoformans]|uniref:Flagellar hook-basal body complex protein FliE n=2 Tax=Cereibacter TaxID=1653176 RepID=A0A2T5KDI3_9RHOB|nr:flagellar hook-basal body complex protein FliE [Cereibacter azotoformans]AXQ93661.1 flagellar hook-basal body complex protein FliE [Cereibacter sphaeroides]MBO4168564.1 flagellar hook-basal body complex protein FliE [Cereibacter azotoformans]PTR20446.1 flagellar hook-basal body complex protein FliE [Cereibacter azotoformans]UIJ32004.1 flagellar hook-basal body complex protein FliE [Cereibacter azotoformans]ULB09836.1 flagellar hook-basal body complex protein FliE [Cereibacter azotoformans]